MLVCVRVCAHVHAVNGSTDYLLDITAHIGYFGCGCCTHTRARVCARVAWGYTVEDAESRRIEGNLPHYRISDAYPEHEKVRHEKDACTIYALSAIRITNPQVTRNAGASTEHMIILSQAHAKAYAGKHSLIPSFYTSTCQVHVHVRT